jgi:hypothetical protein
MPDFVAADIGPRLIQESVQRSAGSLPARFSNIEPNPHAGRLPALLLESTVMRSAVGAEPEGLRVEALERQIEENWLTVVRLE